MPDFLGKGVGTGGYGGQAPDKLRKKQAGDHDNRKYHDFRLDNPADAGAGKLNLPKINGGFTIIVNRNGRIPDLNALIAEIFGTGNKADLPDQRQADKLPGNTFHPGSNIRNDRGVDKAVSDKK